MLTRRHAWITWPFTAVVTSAIVCASVVGTAAESSRRAGDAALFDRLDANGDAQIAPSEIGSDHQRLFARLVRNADADGDGSLSRDEFLASMVPSRPDKPIEARVPASLPQADAVRWLLLSLDSDGNSTIKRSEVPARLQRVFTSVAEQLDDNKDDTLNRHEMNRGNRQLLRIANRYVQNNGIDTAAELKKFDQRQGAAARRFDAPPPNPGDLTDPRQASQLFAQLDGNGDGQIESSELDDAFRRRFERLLRLADRNRDGKLSQREFLAAVDRLSRREARQAAAEISPDSTPADPTPADAMPAREGRANRGKESSDER